jgi:DNA-binding HxlR family transcriptional regulator
MCYTHTMKTADLEQTTAIPEACATTPLRRAICLVGDMWVLLIVMHLLQGSMRFNALRTELGHISSKTLSNRLKVLEELGFVRRQAFLEIPPRVEYHLTEQGRELGEVIEAIDRFGTKYLSDQHASMVEKCAPVSPGTVETDPCHKRVI